MTQRPSRRRRGVTVLVCLALALAGCTDYRVSLDPVVTGEEVALRSGAEVPSEVPRSAPQPSFKEQDLGGGKGDSSLEGYVRLRFSVDERGEVSDIAVVESSDIALEARAVQLLDTWAHQPGEVEGEPAAFQNMEAYLTFYTQPGAVDTPEETLTIIGIIVASFAVVAVLSLTTGVDFFAR